jgi:DNA gyrase/topoisomerase IV subunit B
MDIEITKSLLTATRLEAKKFYGNTNIIGLIDAISAEIDAEEAETEDARYDAWDAADDALAMAYDEGAL